jgi:sphingoid base N-palmitoyltransferase
MSRLTFTAYSISSAILGLYYVSKQEWIADLVTRYDTGTIVKGYPQTPASMGCDMFYIVELSFWVSCFFYLFIETRRKDIVEMTIHHVTTIILVGLSYVSGFGRPGILAMVIHDVGDIFLYAAKTCQYRKLQTLADILFAIFAVVFYVSRLWFFPVYVIYPLITSLTMNPLDGSLLKPFASVGHFYTLVFLTTLLCILLCLHCMWGWTIARMVKRSLSSKNRFAETGDPRSDSEDEGRKNRDRRPAKSHAPDTKVSGSETRKRKT